MDRLRKLYFWGNALPAAAILIFTFSILFFLRSMPSRLPLFYSLPWGEKELAEHWQFFVLPASLALVTLLNLAIFHHLHQQQTFFKKILVVTTILSTLILTITFIKIIFLFI